MGYLICFYHDFSSPLATHVGLYSIQRAHVCHLLITQKGLKTEEQRGLRQSVSMCFSCSRRTQNTFRLKTYVGISTSTNPLHHTHTRDSIGDSGLDSKTSENIYRTFINHRSNTWREVPWWILINRMRKLAPCVRCGLVSAKHLPPSFPNSASSFTVVPVHDCQAISVCSKSNYAEDFAESGTKFTADRNKHTRHGCCLWMGVLCLSTVQILT